MKTAATILAAASLAACTTVPPMERIVVDDSYTKVLRDVRVVRAAGPSFSPLQAISARSCQRISGDTPASAEDGTKQLQIKAQRLGGNAVAGVQCAAESPSSTFSTNCWTSVLCTGVAGTISVQ